MRDITLGQYFPGESIVHRLDPRTKILLMIFLIVIIFLIESMYLFILPTVFILSVVSMAKVPVSYVVKSLKPLRWLLVFMFIINVFLVPGETVLFEWWIITITKEAIIQAFYISIRLILLVAGTSLMTLTTSPISLTDGLERLFMPLSRFKFPAHELAMMMSIALRFIPTLMEEADKIRKAQLSRGADFESGSIIKRAKSMIPILVPLFISSFRRADELAMAMESRCYHGGEGRTRMNVLAYHARDAIATAVVACLCAIIVVAQIFFL